MDEPFLVICDKSNNSPEDITESRLNVDIILFDPILISNYINYMRGMGYIFCTVIVSPHE